MPSDTAALDDQALDRLFRTARTHYHWEPTPVDEADLRALYDLLKFGPTSANGAPARFLFCVSDDARARLADCVSAANRAKVLGAPCTVVIGTDLRWHDKLPELFPHADAKSWFEGDEANIRETGFRNAALQGAWLIMAARALGFDTGPMSGFDRARVDAAFFAGMRVETNFICSIGHGTAEGVFPRLPRLAFEDACAVL